MKLSFEKISLVLLLAALPSTVMADWTCQGVCGYHYDGTYSRDSDYVLAIGTEETPSQAYSDALSKCRGIKKPDRVPMLITPIGVSTATSAGLIYIPATITNACVKD